MKNKYAKIYILFVATAAVLTGCYPKGVSTISEMESNDSEYIISEIASENEHLTIDVTLPENVPDQLPKVNVNVMEWDEDVVNDLYLFPRQNLIHSEYPCDFFTGENYQLFESTDESAYRLVYEPGRLSSAVREKFVKYGYGTLESGFGTYCFSDYYNDGVEDYLGSEAEKELIRQLVQLGLTNLANPEVYLVTAEKANEYFSLKGYDEYEKWTDDNQIFLVRYPLEYGGIKVTTDASSDLVSGGHGSYFVGSYITAIVTNNEVLSLDCQNIMSAKYDTGKTVSIVCNASHALKVAAEYYDAMSLGDSDIKLLDLSLVYVPFEQHSEKEFTLVPMWKVNAVVKNEEDIMGSFNYLFIDAEDGHIIIW